MYTSCCSANSTARRGSCQLSSLFVSLSCMLSLWVFILRLCLSCVLLIFVSFYNENLPLPCNAITYPTRKNKFLIKSNSLLFLSDLVSIVFSSLLFGKLRWVSFSFKTFLNNSFKSQLNNSFKSHLIDSFTACLNSFKTF